MSVELQFACYLVAFIAFLAKAVGVSAKIELLAAGLAAWVLVPLVITGRAIL